MLPSRRPVEVIEKILVVGGAAFALDFIGSHFGVPSGDAAGAIRLIVVRALQCEAV